MAWDVGPLVLRVQQLGGRVEEQAELAVRDIAEWVLGEATEVVPHESGDLQNSGQIATDGLAGVVFYDTPYAVRQHEDMTYTHDDGRTAKYLERPLVAASQGVAQKMLARRLRSVLR